jgi:hypothetical protein
VVRIETTPPTQLAKYHSPVIQSLEKHFKIGWVGRAYMRSIVEAQSTHVYEGWWHLALSCGMRDKLYNVAQYINSHVAFANVQEGRLPMLPATHWRKNSNGPFECTTKMYAAALNAIVAPGSGSQMECRGLVELIALRALQIATGDKRFDELLTARLGTAPLTIGNLPTPQIRQYESLTAKGAYVSDGLFRPGDMVLFSNIRSTARGSIWLVENAICVGWRADTKNRPRFRDPLFIGGGVLNLTSEAQMRELIYQKTPDLNVMGNRAAHFAEKAIGGPKCTHLLDTNVKKEIAKYEDDIRKKAGMGDDAELSSRQQAELDELERRRMKIAVPDIFLFTEVDRIVVLGGRLDVL